MRFRPSSLSPLTIDRTINAIAFETRASKAWDRWRSSPALARMWLEEEMAQEEEEEEEEEETDLELRSTMKYTVLSKI